MRNVLRQGRLWGVFLGVWLIGLLGGSLRAVSPLTESRFTQVVNEVGVIQMPNQQLTPAKVAGWVRAPDRIRTGTDSMAELEAVDKTLTRIGANTIFSFGQDRSMRLERGSILFHSPKGKGGGKIQTGGASASVLGTTIIVSATADGGFKTIVLEGKAQVRLDNGDFRVLEAGQLAFILPGSKRFGPVLTINLGKMVQNAGLVNEFAKQLSSMERVDQAVLRQNRLFASGQAVDTGILVGRQATQESIEVLDASVMERLLERKHSLEAAVREDAVVNGNGLPENHVFQINKAQVPTTRDQGLAEVVAARNLSIRAPGVDISPQMAGPADELIFYAKEELSVDGSVAFTGNGRSDFTLTLHGEKRIKIKSKARLSGSGVGNLSLETPGELKLKNVQISNTSGHIDVYSGDKLEWNGSTVTSTHGINGRGAEQTLKGSHFAAAPAGATLEAYDGDLKVDSSVINASTPSRLSASRDVTLKSNSRLIGTMLVIDAGRDLTMENSSLVGSSLAARAGDVLDSKQLSLAGLSTINMAARTLVLEDIAFPLGSRVELRSEQGKLAPDPNTGRSVVSGHVNFIRNVNYGGAPAQNAVGGAIQILPTL